MNIESIKSAILIVLVCISLFFTWNMWSTQPYLPEYQDDKFFDSNSISNEKRQVYEVVKPQQLFIHTNENHYSTLDDNHLEDLWLEMQEWEYTTSDQRISQTFTEQKFNIWIHGLEEAKLELRFFDKIPIETVQSFFDWNSDKDESLDFDRIYLNVPKENEIQKVYFVATEEMRMIETSVSEETANQFVSNLFNKREEFPTYFGFYSNDGTEFMLPTNELKLKSFQYVTNEIGAEKFKNALFSDPRLVKQDVILSKNRYTDGTRELNIYPNQHLVEYVNPIPFDTNSIQPSHLINQSINYINDHGGWTDNYVLFNIDEFTQEIRYIMSLDSIPVINSVQESYGPTMISQRWGQNEIAIYERPFYQLKERPISSQPVTLMSGKKVEELLIDSDNFDDMEIKNIFVAYELGGSVNNKYVNLTPAWCVELQDGTLLKIKETKQKVGGDEIGVE
ncbi:YycH family regulatory protein [Metabacillus litoralis]|uniref:YycH family regulatory protein n=1 Tax=Metabacillus litoralis TaxID=152268 RepID=UPI001CFCB7D3|nr:two-component system activity regulator YycH [Metabacillus litoralis]